MPVIVIRSVPALFVLLWATGFIGARYAMPWAEPFAFLAVRFLLAGLILAALIAILHSRRLGPIQAIHAMMVGILIHGLYLGGVFWAIDHGMPAGLAALIMGLQPLITALMAGAFLGERVQGRHWMGLAIGLAGVIMVLWPRLGEIDGGVTAATLTSCIIAVAGISAGTVWQKRYLGSVDLVTGTLYQYLGAGIVMTAAALMMETGTYQINGEVVFAMAWLVFVLSIGAIFLLMYLIRMGEMSKVSSLFYLVPGVTAILAWLLFDESLNSLQIAGMLVTTIGVALATQAVTRARASR